MSNIIYCLYSDRYTYSEKLQKQGIKIGSTCNIISRCKNYLTGFIDGVPLLCYYKINKNCYIVDNNLKKDFDHIRLRSLGGIEFYDAEKMTTIVLEQYFINNNIQFTKYLPDDILFEKYIKPKNSNDLQNESKDEINKSLNDRDIIQNEYVNEALYNLDTYGKVLIKAPTGFGKSTTMYKILYEMKSNKILIFTPRQILNKQIVEEKYFNNNDLFNFFSNYTIYHNSDTKFTFQNNNKIIVTACYQSYDNFNNTSFDLVVYDEAHTISEKINFIESKYKLFLTATPTEEMISKENIFGKIIEKVKVYDLIRMNILCDIETICKKLDTKKNFADLGILICNAMKHYNKCKGLVCLNTCENAKSLY